jgi:hypothetical protein
LSWAGPSTIVPDTVRAGHGPRVGLERADPARAAARVALVGAMIFLVSYPRALSPRTMAPFMIALGIAALLLVVLRARPWRGGTPVAVLLVVGLGCASVAWSTNATATLKAAGFYGVLALVALVAARACRPRDLVRGVALGALLIVAGSLVASAQGTVMPYEWVVDPYPHRYGGLYMHWNIMAYTLTLTLPAVAFIDGFRGARWLALGLVTGAVVFLVPVHSATGFMSAAVALVAAAARFALPQLDRLRAAAARVAPRVLVGGGVLGAAVVVGATLGLLKAMGKDLGTLTGRVPVWREVADNLDAATPWGLGLGTVWKEHWLQPGGSAFLDTVVADSGYDVGHGHSSFFDLLPQVGVLGVALVAVAVVRIISLCVHGRWDSGLTRAWAATSVLVLLFVGVAEPALTAPIGFFLLVLVATAAEGARRRDDDAVPRHASAAPRGGARR